MMLYTDSVSAIYVFYIKFYKNHTIYGTWLTAWWVPLLVAVSLGENHHHHHHHRTFSSPMLSRPGWAVWNFLLEVSGTRTLCLQRSRAGPLPICPKCKVCCFCRFRKYHSNMRESSLYLLLSDKEDPLYNAWHLNRENPILHPFKLNVFTPAHRPAICFPL